MYSRVPPFQVIRIGSQVRTPLVLRLKRRRPAVGQRKLGVAEHSVRYVDREGALSDSGGCGECKKSNDELGHCEDLSLW